MVLWYVKTGEFARWLITLSRQQAEARIMERKNEVMKIMRINDKITSCLRKLLTKEFGADVRGYALIVDVGEDEPFIVRTLYDAHTTREKINGNIRLLNYVGTLTEDIIKDIAALREIEAEEGEEDGNE